MRGLAAIAVVLYHTTLRYPAFMGGRPTPATPLFPGFTQIEAGILPVLCFFLLSGFVITWTVDRSRTPMDFVISRVSRIYPAYWASLLLTVAALLLFPLPGVVVDPAVVLANVSMMQSWLLIPDVAGVYWSLAVELTFYAFALAVFALGQWRRVHLAAFAWATLALAHALLARAGIETSWRLGKLLLVYHAPFLLAGMALYHLWRHQHPVWSAATLALSAVAILLILAPVAAGLCFVIMGAIAGSARIGHRGAGWPPLRPLLWLGSVSYPLYLVHEYPSYMILRAMDAAALPHAAAIGIALAVSLLLAAAVSYGVERPSLRLIRGAWNASSPPAPQLTVPKS